MKKQISTTNNVRFFERNFLRILILLAFFLVGYTIYLGISARPNQGNRTEQTTVNNY